VNRFKLSQSGFLFFISIFTMVSCSHFKNGGLSGSDGGDETTDNSGMNSGFSKVDEDSVEVDPNLEKKDDDVPDDLGEIPVSSQRNQAEVEADSQAQTKFVIVENEFVDQWIRFFTENKSGRKTFEKWLSRKNRYLPLIDKRLKADGLPPELVYLAMIESGFNPRAYSHAAAVGVWQFIKGTGSRYQLRIDHWVDERRDIEKATHAAAVYLKELQQIFGSWYLAAASYNAGEGRTLRVVRESKTRNFWELIRNSSNYRKETRNYVPKIIAAAILSRNPEKYGFTNIEYESPIEWDLVTVQPGVALRAIADVIQMPYADFKLYNPELFRDITPPNADSWAVKVPKDKKELLLANLDKLKSQKHGFFIVHVLERGENLGTISRRYGTSVQTIMDLNNIDNPRRIRNGTKLQIPVNVDSIQSRRKRSEASGQAKNSAKTTKKEVSTPRDEGSFLSYEVQAGDTLWDLSKRFGVTVADIKQINGLNQARSIKAGDTIKIPKANNSNRSM
jgi:membrane-bound lytic murein transglycosylase D